MQGLLLSATALTPIQIIERLHDLRNHCFSEYSQFAVAAIIECKLPDHTYVYIGGVNVENDEHNRLGLHAEQNAIAAAQTLLGDNIQHTNIWIMGAPAAIKKGSTNSLATHFVMPCGHCRQILMSFFSSETNIFSVSVSSEVKGPISIDTLLPDAFSERDLNISSHGFKNKSITQINGMLDLLTPNIHLNKAQIDAYLSECHPHLIHPDFQTSSITACLLKIKVGADFYYIPGALVQDIAFLTTDAIFSAIGFAVTNFGAEFEIEAVHFQNLSHSVSLSATENKMIKRFSKKDTTLYT